MTRLSVLALCCCVYAERRPFVGWYAPNALHMSDDWFTEIEPRTLTHYFVEDRHVEFGCGLDTRPQDDADLEGVPREEFQMPRLRTLANAYDFKIMLMLGGWGGSFHYADCVAPENRSNFVKILTEYLVKYDFDGVDLDFEHIGIGGAADFEDLFDPSWNPTDPNEQRAWHTKAQRDELLAQGWTLHRRDDGPNFNAFVKDLRASLDEAGKQTNKRYEIASAMSIGGQAEACMGRLEGMGEPMYLTQDDETRFRYANCGRVNWGELCRDLDYLSIMVYDIWGSHMPFTASHHAPLDCDPADPLMRDFLSPPFTEPCQPRMTVKNAIQWFMNPNEPGAPEVATNGGCDPAKLTIGFPTYGKGLCNTAGPYKSGEACSSTAHGSVANFANPSYKDIRIKGPFVTHPEHFANQTSQAGNLVASYYYDPNNQMFITYDSAPIIHEKAKYAGSQGLGGYFFYHAGQDYQHELDHAAWEGYYEGQGVAPPSLDTDRCASDEGVMAHLAGASFFSLVAFFINV